MTQLMTSAPVNKYVVYKYYVNIALTRIIAYQLDKSYLSYNSKTKTSLIRQIFLRIYFYQIHICDKAHTVIYFFNIIQISFFFFF